MVLVAQLASPRWPPGVVVKRGWLVRHPSHKSGNLGVCPQRLPGVELPGQFALSQRGVDFSVADAVNQRFGFTALAARHQVMFVHAGPGFQRAIAQQAQQHEHLVDASNQHRARVLLARA